MPRQEITRTMPRFNGKDVDDLNFRELKLLVAALHLRVTVLEETGAARVAIGEAGAEVRIPDAPQEIVGACSNRVEATFAWEHGWHDGWNACRAKTTPAE